MRFVRLSLIFALLTVTCACQMKLKAVQRHDAAPTPPPVDKSNAGPEYSAYVSEVRKQWSDNNIDWLEAEDKKLNVSKERLPGGYWKLRVLYRTVESAVDTQASDVAWQAQITRLENWTQQHPTVLMPRVILADVWRSYAWKVRGTGLSSSVKGSAWPIFDERINKSDEILQATASFGEKSPEWYLTALLTARGQGLGRDDFEHLFEESIALEPTYYYLYQAKAGHLLPQWYGRPGEWETFTEAAANRVGGEQGDIILFMVFTDMMARSSLDFMDKHKTIAPRLLAGFRAVDKLYGASPQRLNEACWISFFVDDNKVPAELMKRIGNEPDLSVWRDESNFNIFRQEALMRSGEMPRYRQSGRSQK